MRTVFACMFDMRDERPTSSNQVVDRLSCFSYLGLHKLTVTGLEVPNHEGLIDPRVPTPSAMLKLKYEQVMTLEGNVEEAVLSILHVE